MTLSFFLTTLIVVASPGTGVLYTLAVALAQGSRASIAAAFGCTLGIVPQMIGAMLGLAAILHTSALAFAALKWCGVAYLLYMAWQALRETGALAINAEPSQRSMAAQPSGRTHSRSLGYPSRHRKSQIRASSPSAQINTICARLSRPCIAWTLDFCFP